MLRIVLRLLLCLTLVLNGAGYAVAATQMQIAHEAMATRAADAQKPARPCHEVADAGAGHVAPVAEQPAPQGHGTDCCQTSLCTCDCLQHATAAMAFAAIPPAALPGRGMGSPRETRSPAPPFHTPLRPPIA